MCGDSWNLCESTGSGISASLHFCTWRNVNEVTTKTVAVATKGNLTAREPIHAGLSLVRALSLFCPRAGPDLFRCSNSSQGGTESATPNAGTDMNATARQSTGWPSATWVQSNGAGPCFDVVNGSYTVPSRSSLPFAATFPCPFELLGFDSFFAAPSFLAFFFFFSSPSGPPADG